MAKRLYDGQDRFSDPGNTIDHELSAVIEPIFKKWYAQGYSIRDIAHIAYGVVGEIEAVIALRHAAAQSRAAREAMQFAKPDGGASG